MASQEVSAFFRLVWVNNEQEIEIFIAQRKARCAIDLQLHQLQCETTGTLWILNFHLTVLNRRCIVNFIYFSVSLDSLILML